MAKTHIVKQGETLSSIALENGFRNFHFIFDHPKNAALKAIRDPHVLFPGDALFIPDIEPKSVERPTGSLHRFVLQTSRLLLRLRLLDVNGRPFANTACDVGLAAGKEPDLEVTDADGGLEKPVAADVRKGEVIAHVQVPPKKDAPQKPPAEKVKFDLRIGGLNPEFKLSGQQARLNNLGYFAGYVLKDLDQLLWAAEEFACDKISKPVTKRPKIEPAPPQGEDDETKSDPVKRTGITDEPIFKKIKLEHGI
jgi:hypothetical protein